MGKSWRKSGGDTTPVKKVEGAVITLKEAALMKLFCDAYFMRQVKKKHARKAPQDTEAEPQADRPSDAPASPPK